MTVFLEFRKSGDDSCPRNRRWTRTIIELYYYYYDYDYCCDELLTERSAIEPEVECISSSPQRGRRVDLRPVPKENSTMEENWTSDRVGVGVGGPILSPDGQKQTFRIRSNAASRFLFKNVIFIPPILFSDFIKAVSRVPCFVSRFRAFVYCY